MSSLEARIDRLESLDAIRQLPAKYALCLDMRDIDMMVTLFEPHVRVGREQSGRKALRAYMDGTLRAPFTGTSHHIGGHIIEFDDADHAHGVVYSKNEHETPVDGGQDEWVIMQMMYVDDYVRVDGQWFFARRLPLYWYATDLNKPPVGEKKMRWPGTERWRAISTSSSRAMPNIGRAAETMTARWPHPPRWRNSWKPCGAVRKRPR
jgi:hypothetical protein